jgi:hypothetical protein
MMEDKGIEQHKGIVEDKGVMQHKGIVEIGYCDAIGLDQSKHT